MTNFCGIDFGTSNSTLGVMEKEKPVLVNLEHNSQTIPSAIFYEFDDDEIVFGRQALDYYKNLYAGRLLRSFKSVLGTNLMKEKTQIKHKRLGFESIIATYLNHLKTTAEKQVGNDLDSVVLGRPIRFVDEDDKKDLTAENTLVQIARDIGFKNIEVQYEPIAASLKYEQSVKSEELVLIVDIGGGTSDISIIRLSPERSKKQDRSEDCLANTGVHIGGTDFDKYLSLRNVMPLLGCNQPLKEKLYMPSHLFHEMTTWHRINHVYTKQFMLDINSYKGKLKNSCQFERLTKVIREKEIFSIALLVEQAKMSLSNVNHVEYDFSFMEQGLSIGFSEQDLEESISNHLIKIGGSIENCLKQAGITRNELDSVFLTGGSSQMKLVKEFISSCLPGIPISNQDTLSSVGTGLVIDANRRFR